MIIDEDGEVTSAFIPPKDAQGRSVSYRDWLPHSLVCRLKNGESLDDIESQLMNQVGFHTIWYGTSEHFIESVRLAIGVLRREVYGSDTKPVPKSREAEPT